MIRTCTFFFILLLISIKSYSQGIFINELLASNTLTQSDEFGEYDDWIEIYNSTSQPFDIAGYYVSDDPGDPLKYQIPTGSPVTIVPASGFLLLWADGTPLQGLLHVGFKLSSSGEFISIHQPDGITLVDSVQFGQQETDVSFGRFPDGADVWHVFQTPTPQASNDVAGTVYVEPPLFSHTGGFYISAINLDITSSSGATIRYTLDGSEPNETSAIYTGPIVIDTRAGEPNYYSIIPTNYVQAGPSEYIPPTNEVFKISIVKARCYTSEGVSATVTQSYFVDNAIYGRYDMPIFSLSTNAENFFSDSIGIYVPGDSYVTGNDETGNYFNSGDLWERKAVIEYFDPYGVKMFDKQIGVRTHGAASRVMPQKTLRLYANSFDYKFFEDKDIDSFSRLLLRNSGQDRKSTLFRDLFMQSLIKGMNSDLEYIAGTPSVLFLNGEYWGIHNIRERLDKYYIASNADVNPDSIDFLEYDGNVIEGDTVFYSFWYNYLAATDLSDSANYAYISGLMDIDNFIDYNLANIYFANVDWPSNNREFWRPKTADGKFRWILFDTDFGFGLEDYSNYDHNTLYFATDSTGPTSPPVWDSNLPFATIQLRKLLQNGTFRNDFVNRMADMLNTAFSSDSVMAQIDIRQLQYSHNMPEHIDRWSLPATMQDWISNVDVLRVFAQNRPGYVRNHIIDYFNEVEPEVSDITATANVTLDVTHSSMGSIKMNTIYPGSYPWVGVYFTDVPIPIKAESKPGYFFVEWEGTGITNPEISVVLTGDTVLKAIFAPDENYYLDELHINEVMASNSSTIEDEHGEYDDWIEIYNAAPVPVDLGGLYITDDPDSSMKFRIPTGTSTTVIPSGGYLVLWADGTPAQGVLHTNFKLSASGEWVGLYDAEGINLLDAISFGQQTADISYGSYPDGSDNLELMQTPTPGASNTYLSVSDVQQVSQLSIFPNPASDIINISEVADLVEIYSMNGQIAIRKNNTQTIDVNSLTPGVYFVRINNLPFVKLIVQ